MELLLLLGASAAYLIYCYAVFVCTNYYITGAYLFGFTLAQSVTSSRFETWEKKKNCTACLPQLKNSRRIYSY